MKTSSLTARAIRKTPIPEELDRRKKLTKKQKERIREEYQSYNISQKALAQKYRVSQTTICTIVSSSAARKKVLYDKLHPHRLSLEQMRQANKSTRAYKEYLARRGVLVPDFDSTSSESIRNKIRQGGITMDEMNRAADAAPKKRRGRPPKRPQNPLGIRGDGRPDGWDEPISAPEPVVETIEEPVATPVVPVDKPDDSSSVVTFRLKKEDLKALEDRREALDLGLSRTQFLQAAVQLWMSFDAASMKQHLVNDDELFESLLRGAVAQGDTELVVRLALLRARKG